MARSRLYPYPDDGGVGHVRRACRRDRGQHRRVLAARALMDRFREVVLVERDRFPATAADRKGVPQARHAHVLLSTGKEAPERLLPGMVPALVQEGAVLVDAIENIRWFDEGGFHCRFSSGITHVMVSRSLLEQRIRERSLARPGVRAEEECDVAGLIASEDRRRVTGIRLIRRQKGKAEEALSADLAVDASGRGSRTPAWLQSMGYEPPEKEERRPGQPAPPLRPPAPVSRWLAGMRGCRLQLQPDVRAGHHCGSAERCSG